MSKTAKINVPSSHGDEIVISLNGEDPQTFKVHDGHITVPTEVAPRIAAALDGEVVESASATPAAK